jgi:cytochrome c oxidase subunit 2
VPIHLYERIFLWLTVAVMGVFLVAIFVGALALGVDVPGPAGRIDPDALAEHPLFSEPGVFELAPSRYRVVMIGQVWAFAPNTVEVPAGSEVTFVTTSRDIIHGLKILDTNLNVMLIPGQVSEVTHTFDQAGEYLMVCHEYCGAGHQAMYGRVLVTPAEEGPVAREAM